MELKLVVVLSAAMFAATVYSSPVEVFEMPEIEEIDDDIDIASDENVGADQDVARCRPIVKELGRLINKSQGVIIKHIDARVDELRVLLNGSNPQVAESNSDSDSYENIEIYKDEARPLVRRLGRMIKESQKVIIGHIDKRVDELKDMLNKTYTKSSLTESNTDNDNGCIEDVENLETPENENVARPIVRQLGRLINESQGAIIKHIDKRMGELKDLIDQTRPKLSLTESYVRRPLETAEMEHFGDNGFYALEFDGQRIIAGDVGEGIWIPLPEKTPEEILLETAEENLPGQLYDVLSSQFNLASGEVLDFCAHEVCLNGGKCTNKLNGFECSCPEGFAGPMCEIMTVIPE